MGNKPYSVGQINQYIKNMFVQDFVLKNLYVKGEVSNCKYHTSGHVYFSLKDDTGNISCIIFAGMRKGMAFHMQDGQEVIVLGSINVYERDGKYQLYAKEIILDGAGLLYEKFEMLKKELEEMGMFDAGYKRAIPRYIRTLGIVTASTGAAIHDIMNIAGRRNPYVQLILYPALVQGEGAAESIVRGIHMLEKHGVDVIIVGRGGGSIEDLWAFNEEKVARAIFSSSVPIISAVGHETDVTIADYVADLRAPTPSAAAELAVEDYSRIKLQIEQYRLELSKQMQNRLMEVKGRKQEYSLKINYLSPDNQLREKRMILIEKEDRLQQIMMQKLNISRNKLAIYIERLKGMSPLEKLNQGYAYVADQENHRISSIQQVKEGNQIRVYVKDGVLLSKIEKKERVYAGKTEKEF